MHLSTLSILFVLLACPYLAQSASCNWTCTGGDAVFDSYASFCWTCDTGGAPNATHDVSINAESANSISVTFTMALRSLTVTGIPLTITNAIFTLGSSLTASQSTVTITKSTLAFARPLSGSKLNVNIVDGSFAASSLNLVAVNLNTNSTVTISGNSSFNNYNFNIRRTALFTGDTNGAALYVAGGDIMNYGNTTFGTNAIPNFDFYGSQSTRIVNNAGGWINVGQGLSYGEVDTNLVLLLLSGSTLNVLTNKLIEPMYFSAVGAKIILNGWIRFDTSVGASGTQVSASISSSIFAETTPGTFSAYNGGAVILLNDVNLPAATLDISGGKVGFVTPVNAPLASLTASFRMVTITSGGSLGNHWTDLTVGPLIAIVNTNTFSVIQGTLDMVQGFGLTVNANTTIFQDWIILGDHTSVLFPGGVVVLGSDIIGDLTDTDGLVMGPQTQVQLYSPGKTWNRTTVEIQSSIQFYFPPAYTGATPYINAPSSSLVLTNAKVEVVLSTPPVLWGNYSLVASSAVPNPPMTSGISGAYSCLGGSIVVDSRGLTFSQPAPFVSAPTAIAASMSGATAVVRWAAPTNLPCYTSIAGYSVQIGSDSYSVVQKALVLDSNLFPACQLFSVQVKALLKTTFSPSLDLASGFSVQDDFTNVPAPLAPANIATTVDASGATATIKFGQAPSAVCQCSSILTSAYYQISYLSVVTNVTSTQATLTSIPTDHDIDVSSVVVCVYSVDPYVVVSPATVTRISTSATSDNLVNNPTVEDNLTKGQIAGIVLGVVGALVVGVLAGLVVAKRAYVRMGNDGKI